MGLNEAFFTYVIVLQLSPLWGLLKVGTGAASDPLTGFWTLIHNWVTLSSLIDEEVLSLTVTPYVMLC